MKNQNNILKKLSTPAFDAEYSHSGGYHHFSASNPFGGGTIFFFGLSDSDFDYLTRNPLFNTDDILRGVGDFSVFVSTNNELENKFRKLTGKEQLAFISISGLLHNAMLEGSDKAALTELVVKKGVLPSKTLKKWLLAFLDCLIDTGEQVVLSSVLIV